ncbi:hypothetical protein ACOME3_008129 [Neoechinorhynchus agilis]
MKESADGVLLALSRDEPNVNELLLEDHEISKQYSELEAKVRQAENAERQAFKVYSAAIRENHARDRIHSYRNRQFSMLSTITGTIAGLACGAFSYKTMLIDVIQDEQNETTSSMTSMDVSIQTDQLIVEPTQPSVQQINITELISQIISVALIITMLYTLR